MYKNKFTIIVLAAFTLIVISCNQQMKDALSGVAGVMNESSTGNSLTNEEVIRGLREALTLGAENAAGLASKTDGFNQNPRLKIPFPEDAIKVREKALDLGLRTQVERFELTLNRAAEEAAKEAAPIFINAVRNMSVQDGFEILRGNDDAATRFLERTTSSQLRQRFAPVVSKAIETVELTKYWDPLASAYNTATIFTGGGEVNPDLENYVTGLAMQGLFILIADEEKKIRENPAARVTDLLKRVFGSQQ
jgi:hypothetical protein